LQAKATSQFTLKRTELLQLVRGGTKKEAFSSRGWLLRSKPNGKLPPKSSSQISNESRIVLFELGKHESLKKQKAIWEAFDIDYEKLREENKQLERQYKRMIKARAKTCQSNFLKRA